MDREEVAGGVSEQMDGGMGWSWEDGCGKQAQVEKERYRQRWDR